MISPSPTMILYRSQPDILLHDWFAKHLNDTGLSLAGLDVNLVFGHPLFQSSATSGVVDRGFPRLGIGHAVDFTLADSGIGAGYDEFCPGDDFRDALAAYKALIPEPQRSPDKIIDAIAHAEVVQRWIEFVESVVVIAGFVGGGGAWMDNRRLCQSVEGLLKPFAHDVHSKVEGVKVFTEGRRECPIEFDDKTHGKLFGFEIALTIKQPRRTYRAQPGYVAEPVDRFDIHVEGSRTVWGQTPGKFGFEAG